MYYDMLPKMVLVDLVFHYGGKWIREPKLLYERKLVHKWEGYDSDLLSYIDITNEYINILGYVGVQQLLVSVPSGKYYEIEGDEGIRTLLSFVNDKFDFNQNSEEGTSNTRQVKSKKKKMDKQCDKGKKQTNERQKTQPTQDCASDEDETENMLEQLRKEKMDMRSNKEKKQGKERHRTLIDEEDVEDFPLTAPQPTQDEDEDEDFDIDIDVEDDMPWKPRDFSELNSRIQQRQNQARPTGSRRINFLGDGPSVPSDLYAPKGLTWKGNASITGRMLEQSKVEKLKTKKDNGKAQQ
ncbi:hypothetical protein KY290_004931 [Solanum tuberosum]|uniref:PB1-like domain-containing protein n=1 Tax=Solanum tuberosum TaxID=4113 RepID=A0ABQ7WCN6_SOLTU|nr:hypothetical protein KY290_004931 [Solanum tuberosum]